MSDALLTKPAIWRDVELVEDYQHTSSLFPSLVITAMANDDQML
jgi:hypothetical protein